MTRLIRATNIDFATVFFNFDMVRADKDDNKFADVFIASNADLIVSNDNKLLALNNSAFPPFQVLRLQEFSSLLKRER